MTITRYMWDHVTDNVLFELDHEGTTQAVYNSEPVPHGRLVSQWRADTELYYQFDGQSSTNALTGPAGNIADTAIYTAFGEIVSGGGIPTNPWWYKGALGYSSCVESESIYVRARNYMPKLARWASQDPLGIIGGTNLYAFSDQNPVNREDVSGLITISRDKSLHPPYTMTCKHDGWIDFSFSIALSAPAVQKGFLFQEVTIKSWWYECPCDWCSPKFVPRSHPRFSTSSHYWENFGPIGKGQTVVKKSGIPVTDHRTIKGFNRNGATCGWASFVGDIRFYWQSQLPGWAFQSTQQQGQFIFPMIQPIDESGTIPASYHEPKWWDTIAPKEQLTWYFEAVWACCRCDDISAVATLAPYATVPLRELTNEIGQGILYEIEEDSSAIGGLRKTRAPSAEVIE